MWNLQSKVTRTTLNQTEHTAVMRGRGVGALNVQALGKLKWSCSRKIAFVFQYLHFFYTISFIHFIKMIKWHWGWKKGSRMVLSSHSLPRMLLGRLPALWLQFPFIQNPQFKGDNHKSQPSLPSLTSAGWQARTKSPCGASFQVQIPFIIGINNPD